MLEKDNVANYEIILRDPESILQKQLDSDLKVINFKTETFLKAGDNYGSTILKVQVLMKRDHDSEEEELNLIAKMIPPTDFQRLLFDIKFSFKKEIFFYENLIPTYCSLYNGIFNIIPKFYGSRLSLRANVDEVEEDAVILMEDLKSAGYYMQDRHKGLDLEHTKITVLSLAKFHAIGLSVKYKKSTYIPNLVKYMKPMPVKTDLMLTFIKTSLARIKSDRELSSYFDLIVGNKTAEQISDVYYSSLEPEDPWACVVHSDLWINNILFHRNNLGSIDNIKFIDFQMSYISSPLTDLIFCLCINMERSLKHLNEMLELYRETIIVYLKELGCDVDLFSRESFEKRLKMDATNELFHILMMVKIIELGDDEVIDSSDMNDDCVCRLKEIFHVFIDKNWY